MTARRHGHVNLAQALAEEFAGTATSYDRSGAFPFENFARLRQSGLLALTVPSEFGGSGAGLADAASVVGTIAAGEPSTALVLAMQYIQHAALARSERWPRHLYAFVAREAANSGALINALRVEPELGTPARGGLPATVAERIAGGWRLTGHKIYCTGAPILRWLLVWARTQDEPVRVGFWLVPAEMPGVRIVETWDQLGMRATGSHDILLEGATVPDDYAVDIRLPEDWAAPDAENAAWSTVVIAALYHGIATSARDWLVRYLNQRKPANLGAALATVPRIQEAVGEIEAMLYASDQILAATTSTVDRQGRLPTPSESGLTKFVVTNNAIRAVERAVSLVGNAGLARANPLERHYRDLLCSRIHTPQNDSALTAAGRAALVIDQRRDSQ